MKENKAGHEILSPSSQQLLRLYLLGKGRLGLQLSRYFKNSKIPFVQLNRSVFSESSAMEEMRKASSTSVVLLAISDPDIIETSEKLFEIFGDALTIVHFSASVQNIHQRPRLFGFHPLFSFTNRDLSTEEFESIPFITDSGQQEIFSEIFPKLTNPVFELNSGKDPHYHALAVLLGNLPITLSKLSAEGLSKKGLPRQALIPFLESVLENFKDPTKAVASGPIARRDQSTLNKHLASLQESPFLESIYRSFIKQDWPEFSSENNSPRVTATTQGSKEKTL